MGREQPTLAYLSNPPQKRSRPTEESTTKSTTTKKSKTNQTKSAKGTKQPTPTTTARPTKKTRTLPPLPPQPVLSLDQRLPLHSPLAHTGIAVSSIKRDLETERENKKKGLAVGSSAEDGGQGSGTPGKDNKQPKMKRMVVRGNR